MSGSIPYYFTPVKWNDCLYVDGALIDNFPIKHFNLDETLGMYVKKHNPPYESINDLIGYTIAILGTLLKVSENELLDKYRDNIIIIENEESMLDFKMSREKRQMIFDMAFSATEDFIQKLLEKERLRKQEEELIEKNEHSNEERNENEEEHNTESRRESSGSQNGNEDGDGAIISSTTSTATAIDATTST